MMKAGGFQRDDPVFQPGLAGCFQKRESSDHVGAHKDAWVQNGAIHMRLGGKMHNGLNFILPKELVQKWTVVDVAVDKDVPLGVRQVF